jgi:DNA gyrase/topoisomerase IV subunit A
LNCVKQRKRAHILEGLIIASDNIDEVIALIKAKNTEEAEEKLIERFKYPIFRQELLLKCVCVN